MMNQKNKPSKKMKPEDWLKDKEFKGITILDPDGWDRKPDNWDKDWGTPLTKQEMWGRVMRSTITRNVQGSEGAELKQG